jgi:hypothetical protein
VMIWQGPPMERARISKHEPAQFYCYLRLDGIWGPMVAQIFGPTLEEASRRARVVRLALEQKEAVS